MRLERPAAAAPADGASGYAPGAAVGARLADELLTTTRAVRRRLDLSRRVPRHLLVECVTAAVQAPSASNRQDWHFVFVEEPARKQAVAEWYARGYDLVARTPPGARRDGDARRLDLARASSRHLRERIGQVPVLLVPCVGERLQTADVARQATFWGSVMPAVWSFMLAARSRGLGTVLTTAHLFHEEEVAGLLGIPYETVTQVGLVPVAFFTGVRFRPGPRLPAERVTHWDAW